MSLLILKAGWPKQVFCFPANHWLAAGTGFITRTTWVPASQNNAFCWVISLSQRSGCLVRLAAWGLASGRVWHHVIETPFTGLLLALCPRAPLAKARANKSEGIFLSGKMCCLCALGFSQANTHIYTFNFSGLKTRTAQVKDPDLRSGTFRKSAQAHILVESTVSYCSLLTWPRSLFQVPSPTRGIFCPVWSVTKSHVAGIFA